jgi:hypothetical protein
MRALKAWRQVVTPHADIRQGKFDSSVFAADLENGVPEVWIVDADECSVEVWEAGQDDPRRPDRVLEWSVGTETFRLDPAEVLA